jgi:hypothetical protein
MKIGINDNRNFTIEECYNPIVLISGKNEKLTIIMRDGGFELYYQTPDSSYIHYEFKEGKVIEIPEETVFQNSEIIVPYQLCPMCCAPEIEANNTRTVYECGSSDYDQRPGSFLITDKCINNSLKEDEKN